MRKTGAILAAVFLACMLLMVPDHISADAVGSSDILVFPADSSSQTVDLGESASYRWILFNNGTSPYYVNATTGTLPDGFSATVTDKEGVPVSQRQSRSLGVSVTG